jgi:microcystin-dependent protein
MPVDISSSTYTSLIPSLDDAANIQVALKLYHFGTNSGTENSPHTTGILGHLNSLNASLGSIQTQISNNTPSGVINVWAGATAPTGWILCQGQAISRTTHASLYSALGGASSPYGQGDGTSTFNVPNLKGRIPVGLDSAQTEFDALGETGGAKTHTLTSAQMPNHTHVPTLSTDSAGTPTGTVERVGNHDHAASSNSAGAHTHTFTDDGTGVQSVVTAVSGASYSIGIAANDAGTSQSTSSAGAHTHTINISVAGAHTHGLTMNEMSGHTHTISIAGTGGGEAHNNLQPYIVMNYIIKS